MSAIARTDTSLVGRWWWTIDRWTLAALGAIIAIGAVLTLAASPPVAERLGLDTFHFAKRQFLFLGLAAAIIFSMSFLSPRGVWRAALGCLAAAMALMRKGGDDMSAQEIAETALNIAGSICVFTNQNLTIEELDSAN